MIKKDFDFQQIVLDRVERYDASSLNCFAFRRGTDVADGYKLALGNMVSGFPFEIEGLRFKTASVPTSPVCLVMAVRSIILCRMN